MKWRITFAGLCTLLAGAALGAGQAPQPADAQTPPPQTPTFKVEVNYVEVDLRVTDAQGRFVTDLTKEDFRVLEDGRPQTISTFSLVNIPVERADRPLFAAQPIEPDVESNERVFDGRVYVLVLDDLHTDFSRSPRVRAAARRFIERYLGANDLMAVVTTGGGAAGAQEFTSKKRLLLAAVDKFTGRKLESATLARNSEFQMVGGRVDDPYDAERGHNARSTLTYLRNVSEWFGGVRGRRKAVVFLSEGIDYDITDVFNNRDASTVMDETRDAITAATRANVSIYAVDARGLATLGDESIGAVMMGDQGASSRAGVGDSDGSRGNRPPAQGIGLRSLMNELRLSQDSLRTLADETGGFAAVNANDFTTAFERIVSDNSGYYVLAYYPPSPKRDGKFHKIEVRVSRPGLTVRARRGYVAPKGNARTPKPADSSKGASPEILEVLSSPIRISGLTMRVFAAPFKGTAPNASVVLGVELRGRDLSLEPGGKVELTYLAVDADGKTRASRTDVLSMDLRPETLARVQQTGFRLVNRLDLPPGRYQLHVASRDARTGRAGSVVYDLDVPDYHKLPFGISGLALTSLSGAAMATARADEQLKAVMPAPPIAQRAFPQNDELALFAEIYDDGRVPPHKVDIMTTVRSDSGTVLYKNEETRDSSELQGQRGGYGYTARIPLTELAAGPYVLTVEARSRLGDRPAASREVSFTITAPAQ